MKLLTCSCGQKTNSLHYKNGAKTCNTCQPSNLSGTFLRRLELEKQYYSKDLIQPSSPHFEELYGKGKNTTRNQ